MRFDDRLKTVMTQPVVDAHDRTVRWRQLVDLLSRPHDEIDPGLLDAALTMVRSGMRIVPKAVRAATARSIAGRAAEPRLLAIFAGDKMEVAAPLLAAAPLDDAAWEIVMAAASKEVAAFVESIRGPQILELQQTPADAPEPEPEEQAPSIGEIAARVERAKSRRDQQEMPAEAEVAPPTSGAQSIPAGGPNLFRWECDPSGQIGWVQGAPRGALIGRSLPAEEGATRELVRAFADRLPFDDAPLTFPAPALEGEWRLSGIPAFSPGDGRFLGYRGVARRDGQPEAAAAAAASGGRADAEALRETIHEIKTPLNAIIGFAEIIDGQYLGPAHRNYRSRAAEIVTQARLLLAAIEDLDFAARISAAAPADRESIDLGEIIPPLAEELSKRGAARDVQLRLTPVPGHSTCLLHRDLAQRLLRRLLTAVVDAASAGEAIRVEVERVRTGVAISATRPMATAQLGDAQLFDPTFSTGAEGDESRLGLGFALRLVRGLAKLAGGDLRISASDFVLTLPKG